MQDPLPTVVVDYLAGLLGNEVVKGLRATGVKSAQQRVWIVEFSSDFTPIENLLPLDWRNALQEGNNRIVIRLWRGGARWWNLNDDDDKSRVGALARAETKAYQIARKALPDLHIPRLLHAKLTSDPFPWAVFSYVGYDSTYYQNHGFAPNRYWIDGMVKIRHEFGFDEPHPRWGRVPQDECLQYTLEVLRNVTMPLHRYLAEHNNTPDVDLCCEDNDNKPITYQAMVATYRRALERKIEGMDDFQQRLYGILQQCIGRLEAMTIEPLPPVLVHMDCQPQNLLFATVVAPDDEEEEDEDKKWCIMSVLDWEEAAYADPRFELLLLGRKVCANRYQADIVWNTYAQELLQQPQQPQDLLGSMEPWLQLERVHSITALFLQSLDLGGRSPWETKPDLWGKIQRELHRLAELGWEFCQTDDAQ